jgi:surface antigen
MRLMLGQSLIWGACFVAGLMGPLKPSRAANCALFARAETGVALYGAAGGWWDEADGRYERGHIPAVGAILVFKRTGQIPSGHVAVVTRIVSAHEILVDHANWYHGTISRSMSVIDTSPGRDWTTVAVMNPPSGTHGSGYPTYGFVYSGSVRREIIATTRAGDSDVVNGSSPAGLLDFAVATEDWQDRGHTATTTRGNHRSKQTASRPFHKAASVHRQNHPVPRATTSARPDNHHAGVARPTAHSVKTAEAKHHRA